MSGGLLQQQPAASTTATALATTGASVNISNAAPPVAGQVFAADGLGGGNWLYVLPAGFVDVTDHLVSGSAVTTTLSAQMTAGTNTCALTDASTFMTGQGVAVAGAGVSGAELITYITGINGNNITLAASASTTVASGSVVYHDDTLAWQTLIDTGVNLWYPAAIVMNITSTIMFRVNGQVHQSPAAMGESRYGSTAYPSIIKRSTSGDLIKQTAGSQSVNGLMFSGVSGGSGYLYNVTNSGTTYGAYYSGLRNIFSTHGYGLKYEARATGCVSERELFINITYDAVTISAPIPYGAHVFYHPILARGTQVTTSRGFHIYDTDWVKIVSPVFGRLDTPIYIDAGTQSYITIYDSFADDIGSRFLYCTSTLFTEININGFEGNDNAAGVNIVKINSNSTSGRVTISGVASQQPYSDAQISLNCQDFVVSGNNLTGSSTALRLGASCTGGVVNGNRLNGLATDNLASNIVFSGNNGTGTCSVGTGTGHVYANMNKGF